MRITENPATDQDGCTLEEGIRTFLTQRKDKQVLPQLIDLVVNLAVALEKDDVVHKGNVSDILPGFSPVKAPKK